MAVFRVNKNKDYTVMSNCHLKDANMSFKAKGLLSMMLSLPDDWDYSIAGLSKISKENEKAIKTILDELKELGYLRIVKLMPNETKSGRIEYIYDIYEMSVYKKQEYQAALCQACHRPPLPPRAQAQSGCGCLSGQALLCRGS